MSRARSLEATGWPVLAGVATFVVGLILLGAAAFFYRQAHKLVESAAQASPPGQEIHARTNTGASSGEAFAAQLPALGTHLDDVGLLFRLATEQGVHIGPITYRSEANPTLPVTLRLAELHMDEEYPKLKAFVAELLRQMPHLYLEEIRVEQGAASSKVQATLKLSFAYQGGKGPAR